MNDELNKLDSKMVLHFFHEISQIPRESKHEQQISDWLVSFAKERNLEVVQDDSLNVIIKKPATSGMEDAPTVALQGHMDMVCEKTKDSTHNFATDPIEWVIKGDMIYANNTTLGADNGIGVAYALALLDAKDIVHPALEVLITSDEETGMSGAHGLDTKDLKAKVFINIDCEEEGKFFLSCAGGNETRISIPVSFNACEGTLVNIEVTGLLGGHSGLEIIKDRANANKLLGRFLNMIAEKNVDFGIIEANGGSKMNVITRDCDAKIVIKESDYSIVEQQVTIINQALKDEYTPQDPDAKIIITKKEAGSYQAMSSEDSLKVVDALVLIPNGPTTYSKYIDGLVQTSSNVGVLVTNENSVELVTALRSSVMSQKAELVEKHNVLGKVIGAKVTSGSFYPAWPFNVNSRIKDIFLETYKQCFNEDGEIVAIHAGLECGIFKEKMDPNVDFISFGPNMSDVHTAVEHVSISSIEKNWLFLKAVLENTKNY